MQLACGPFGFLVGLILGAGMIAEGITSVTADEKIKKDSQKLAELTEKTDSYTRDSLVLMELIDRMQSLNQTLGYVEEALEEINESWKQLEDNMTQVLNTLDNAEEEEKKALYEELIKLLEEADEEWGEVINAAKKVSLNAARPELDQIYPADVA